MLAIDRLLTGLMNTDHNIIWLGWSSMQVNKEKGRHAKEQWSSFGDIPLVEFMYLVFTRLPGDSYHRQLRSLMPCLCDVFQALIISFVCWFSSFVDLQLRIHPANSNDHWPLSPQSHPWLLWNPLPDQPHPLHSSSGTAGFYKEDI